MEFAIQLLKDNAVKFAAMSPDIALQAELLLQSGYAALQFDSLLLSVGPRPSHTDRQNLLNAFLRHLSFLNRSGTPLLPKHHLMVHGIHRMKFLGNMRGYSTYRDESLNGVIATIARSCARCVFGFAVHFKFKLMQTLKFRNAIT
jgi:hypothetical protein